MGSKDYLLYPENIGEYLSIDETAFSNGEIYTVVTNKDGKGKKGTLVAIIKGTQSEKIINILKTINIETRNKVKEITLDMAAPMISICSNVFLRATQVTDRFHVQKLAYEAVQELRIRHRWEAIDLENEAQKKARIQNISFVPEVFPNGDTEKQLLARSRYLLFKHFSKWTASQKNRAEILFSQYPDIHKAYQLSIELYEIYQNTKSKEIAYTKLAIWYKNVEESDFKSFNTVINTVQRHYISILNYFNNRSTNASAESFNSKIKAFRSQFRGVRDINFFLFRLEKLFA